MASRSETLAKSIAAARAANAKEVSSAKATAAKTKTSSTTANGKTTVNSLYSKNQTPTTATASGQSLIDQLKASIKKNTSTSTQRDNSGTLLNTASSLRQTDNDTLGLLNKYLSPMDESYDYSGGANQALSRGAVKDYLNPAATTNDFNQMLADLYARVLAREDQNIEQTYNEPNVTYYDPIEQVANIGSISSGGDMINPTLAAYTAANNAASQAQGAYTDQYNAITAAKAADANATNDVLGTLATLLNTGMSNEYQNSYLDYLKGQSANENTQSQSAAAASRILAGIASPADYALLGINPNTIPYEQLNALVAQDNERRKTELYGLGLTV